MLQALYRSDAFNNLSTSDKMLVIQLLAAAEVDHVTYLIDSIGFTEILAVVDSKYSLSQYLES